MPSYWHPHRCAAVLEPLDSPHRWLPLELMEEMSSSSRLSLSPSQQQEVGHFASSFHSWQKNCDSGMASFTSGAEGECTLIKRMTLVFCLLQPVLGPTPFHFWLILVPVSFAQPIPAPLGWPLLFWFLHLAPFLFLCEVPVPLAPSPSYYQVKAFLLHPFWFLSSLFILLLPSHTRPALIHPCIWMKWLAPPHWPLLVPGHREHRTERLLGVSANVRFICLGQ